MIVLIVLGFSLLGLIAITTIFIMDKRLKMSTIITDSKTVKEPVPIFERKTKDNFLTENQNKQEKGENLQDAQKSSEQNTGVSETKDESVFGLDKGEIEKYIELREKRTEQDRIELEQAKKNDRLAKDVEKMKKRVDKGLQDVEKMKKRVNEKLQDAERMKKEAEKCRKKNEEDSQKSKEISKTLLEGFGNKKFNFITFNSRDEQSDNFKGTSKNVPEIGKELPFN